MKTQGIDINQQIKEIEKALESEKNLSPTMLAMIKMLILIVKLLTNQKGLNSRNSSKPPSIDQTGSKKKIQLMSQQKIQMKTKENQVVKMAIKVQH